MNQRSLALLAALAVFPAIFAGNCGGFDSRYSSPRAERPYGAEFLVDVVGADGRPLAYDPERVVSLCIDLKFENVSTGARQYVYSQTGYTIDYKFYDCLELPMPDSRLFWSGFLGPVLLDGGNPRDFRPWQLTLTLAVMDPTLDWQNPDPANCRRSIWYDSISPISDLRFDSSADTQIAASTRIALDMSRLSTPLTPADPVYRSISACRTRR